MGFAPMPKSLVNSRQRIMKEIDDVWRGWFVGFTDGEGCFLIRKYNRKKSRTNYETNYECNFKIELRNDDHAILEEICNTLGIGKIYNYPARIDDSRKRQATTRYCVNTINDCIELMKVFEKYSLRAKKRHDFEIWKQAIIEFQKPFDCRNTDLLEYYWLKLKEVRKYEAQEELVKPRIKELQLTIKFE